ncbi:MAG: sulfatase-like hydrolase/transferase [Candidatus Sumerlaeota bacterium]|nr:sulfatase-like hydrolase/transferase [Candidatus Sumerlaeota bacterium]
MNVVLLFNETHVFDYLGCMGLPLIETPTADALAADGVIFTQAVCNTTPCLPSRVNLVTGLHGFQTGALTNGHLVPPERLPARPMGTAFREAGCRTAACGKMHLFPYGAPVERGDYFGFDYRAGHFLENGERMDASYPAECPGPVERYNAERVRYGISRGGDGCATDYIGFDSELRVDELCDWWSAQKAVGFVEANKDAPFLLVCSLTGPHPPNAVPKDFVNRYDPELVRLPPEPPFPLTGERTPGEPPRHGAFKNFQGVTRETLKTVIARYMECVAATDAGHALVVDALKRNGLYDDSLIIFTADHGDLMGSRGPTALSKYNLYERAIRVPLIIKPPKSLESWTPGTRCDAPAGLIDLLPTMLDLAGLPKSEDLPGVSLKPLLTGQPCEREDSIAVTEFLPAEPQRRVCVSVRQPEWKLILGPSGDELYHLAEDPNEFLNLSGEARHAARVAEMKSALADYYRGVFRRSASALLKYDRQPFDPFR